MGTVTNQKFVQLPHRVLVDMISYKAALEGITVIETEEAYTSKADVTASDPIPRYDPEAIPPVMSGRRKKRGLYVCHDGLVINADCNGAANIIRKVFPDIWADVNDFSFLSRPEVIGFKVLNHADKRTPVKRIAG